MRTDWLTHPEDSERINITCTHPENLGLREASPGLLELGAEEGVGV